MGRFPALETYRGLLQILAVLVFIGALVMGLLSGELTVFLLMGLYGVLGGLWLLVVAELIGLGLAIEDHLGAIRHALTPSRQSPPGAAPRPAGSAPASERPPDAGSAFNSGKTALSAARYEEAVRLFTQVIDLEQRPQAYFYRSQAYENLGETGKAAEDMATYNRLLKP